MGFELFIALLTLIGIFGIVVILRPHRSAAPGRRITSSRNGYGRGKGR